MNDELVMIVDTETANGLDCPLAYDISFIIADLNGNIHHTFAYVVAEIFLDEELMTSAYYIDKKAQYWEDIKDGKRKLFRLDHIKQEVRKIMANFNITKVFAYNCRFDYLSTNITERYMTKSKQRFFFPYGTEFYDILKLTRKALKGNDEYKEFCITNNFLDKKGRNRHTAEIVYKFLTSVDFEEEHKGLEDCYIEYEILLTLLKGFTIGDIKW